MCRWTRMLARAAPGRLAPAEPGLPGRAVAGALSCPLVAPLLRPVAQASNLPAGPRASQERPAWAAQRGQLGPSRPTLEPLGFRVRLPPVAKAAPVAAS